MADGGRFAVYFAPEADHALHPFGSRWVGRDALTDTRLEQPLIPGLAPDRFAEITKSARQYGFHATLKAPFVAADGIGETGIVDAVTAFANERSPFSAPMRLKPLGGFLALGLAASSLDMQALAEGCVTDLAVLHAPLSEADIARRRKSGLTDHQDALMLKWGYPYVLDEFRFHMTLSGRLPEGPERQAVLAALEPLAADATAEPIPVNGVCVFHQPDRSAPFRLLARCPFRAV